MIEYKHIKSFDEDQLKELFLSVNWFSGNFPQKLKTALLNSSRVISAWEGDTLVGLIRGLDDGAWQATIDCLLVTPDYQGRGIASTLLTLLLDEYSEFLYVDVVPETKNLQFYLKHGFQISEDRTPLQIKGKGWVVR